MKPLGDGLPGWTASSGFLVSVNVVVGAAGGLLCGWLYLNRLTANVWLWAVVPTVAGGVIAMLFLVVDYWWRQKRDRTERTDLQRQVYRLADGIRVGNGERFRSVFGGTEISVHRNGRNSVMVWRSPSGAFEIAEGQTSVRGSVAYLEWSWLGLTTMSFPAHFTAGLPGVVPGKQLMECDIPALSGRISARQALSLPRATAMDEEELRLLIRQLEAFLQHG